MGILQPALTVITFQKWQRGLCCAEISKNPSFSTMAQIRHLGIDTVMLSSPLPKRSKTCRRRIVCMKAFKKSKSSYILGAFQESLSSKTRDEFLRLRLPFTTSCVTSHVSQAFLWECKFWLAFLKIIRQIQV